MLMFIQLLIEALFERPNGIPAGHFPDNLDEVYATLEREAAKLPSRSKWQVRIAQPDNSANDNTVGLSM